MYGFQAAVTTRCAKAKAI